MATETAISMFRGEDKPITFTVTPAEDITGWSLTFTVARRADSTTKLLTKSCTLVTPASGIFKATLVPADTAGIAPGAYFWDVTRTNTGSVTVVGYGAFSILGGARLPPAP